MYRDAYKRAQKKVKAKKGFYSHFSVFISVGLFFFFLNMADGFYDTWFFYPLLPWGVGLSIQYFSVFGLPGSDVLTPEWEDREMERELRRMGYDPNRASLYEEEEEEEEPEEELDLPEIQREQEEKGLRDEDFV